MKQQLLWVVSTAVLGFGMSRTAPDFGLPQDSRAVAKAGIPWRTDLEAARKEAQTANKPLCIVFRCEA